mmetsp:Transcript_48113/g.120486  ORF Transcript_48113/g.120486 Transcript_48113/m.120486 type:complete len:81 (-) Transcript_48113:434-676(-)
MDGWMDGYLAPPSIPAPLCGVDKQTHMTYICNWRHASQRTQHTAHGRMLDSNRLDSPITDRPSHGAGQTASQPAVGSISI